MYPFPLHSIFNVSIFYLSGLMYCFFLVQKLTKGADTWSLSEVMQALIIITHFNSLCSFIFGCGIAPEVDQGGSTLRPTSSSEEEDYSSDSSQNGELNANVSYLCWILHIEIFFFFFLFENAMILFCSICGYSVRIYFTNELTNFSKPKFRYI